MKAKAKKKGKGKEKAAGKTAPPSNGIEEVPNGRAVILCGDTAYTVNFIKLKG